MAGVFMTDRRLKKCAEFVSGEGIVCDVGTDHAYLVTELICSGKCVRAIASDVREKPLESARKNVESCGISDRVELVLSDGLENVNIEGVSDIVIAGMGGETIEKIILDTLKSDRDVKNIKNINWILQPMTKTEHLRKKIYEYGLEIFSENAVEESGKIYTVILARYSGEFCRLLTETESFGGFFENNNVHAEMYRKKIAEKLEKKSVGLEKSGDILGAVHYGAMAEKEVHGVKNEKISEIYKYLDSLYPFNIQESWDNSGLLVEKSDNICSKILLTLDITNAVISEAVKKGADLIISHHPVIFHPLKKIISGSPVFELVRNDVSAMCMHTNVDIAKGGTNGVILDMLKKFFDISGEPEFFEDCGNGENLGWIVNLKSPVSAENFAVTLKKIFGCEYVRVSGNSRNVSKIAFCSGSGGSMLGLALAKGCDGYITGDVKHDVWIDANNFGISLFDCGHFHTENIFLTELRKVLEEKFPYLDIEIAENSVDPVFYI